MREKRRGGPRVLINLQKTAEGFCVKEEPIGAAPERAAPSPPAAEPRAPLDRVDVRGRLAEGLSRSELVAVPTSAAWFDRGAVHRVEREALPEFFVAERGAQTYKRLRNAILELFHERPDRRLPLSAALSRVAFDACAVARLHAFLEHWGLINFAFAAAPPLLAAASTDAAAREAKIAAVERAEAKPRCDVCGAALWRAHWLSARVGVELRLCDECFAGERFPNLLVPSDFARSETAESGEATLSDERRLEFIGALAAVGADPKRLGELEPRFGRAADALIDFLKYPTEHFPAILRLSSNAIENLFKRKDKALNAETPSERALLQNLEIAQLLLECAERPSNGGAQSAISAAARRESVERVRVGIVKQAKRAAKSAEQFVLSEMQQINAISMERLKVKLQMLEEHQKTLFNDEIVLKILQNENLIDEFLKSN